MLFSLKVWDASVFRREMCLGGGWRGVYCCAEKRVKVVKGNGWGGGGLALTEGPG